MDQAADITLYAIDSTDSPLTLDTAYWNHQEYPN